MFVSFALLLFFFFEIEIYEALFKRPVFLKSFSTYGHHRNLITKMRHYCLLKKKKCTMLPLKHNLKRQGLLNNNFYLLLDKVTHSYLITHLAMISLSLS